MSDSQSFNRGRWQKGQSGNPKGRAPIERILADRLRVTAEKPGYFEFPFKNVMARYVWEAIVHGKVELVNGRRIELSDKEWIELIKWVNVHVDGSLHVQRSSTEDELAEPELPMDNTANLEPGKSPYYERMLNDPPDDHRSVTEEYLEEHEKAEAENPHRT